MNKIKNSLKNKLLFFIGALFIILSATLTYYFFSQAKKIMEEELVQRGSTLVRNLAYNSKIGLKSNNKQILSEVIQGVLIEKDVSYVIITGKNNEEIVSGVVNKDKHLKEQLPYLETDNFGVKVSPFFIGKLKFYDFIVPVIVKNEDTVSDEDIYGLSGIDNEEEKSVEENNTKPKEVITGYVRIGLNTASIYNNLSSIRKVGILIMLLILVFAIIILYVFLEYSIGPINELAKVAVEVSKGNLSKKIEVKSNDEIGILGEAFNKMIHDLNVLIGKVKYSADYLSELSKKVKITADEVAVGAAKEGESVEKTGSSVDELNISMREINEGIDSLSSSTGESSSSISELTSSIGEVNRNMVNLTKSVDETSSSITQISVSVKEINSHIQELFQTSENTATSMVQIDRSIREIEENTKNTLELSKKMIDDAKNGKQSVLSSIEGIEFIKESFVEIVNAINSLSDKTSTIGKILNYINDIAEQTNLLALNAAIIAAQAGEEGKSFTVVADEIKELADRTAHYTSEVSGLMDSLDNEVSRSKTAISKGETSIETGINLSKKASFALDNIMNSAKNSSERINIITKATVEQSRGSHEVTESINSIVEKLKKISYATVEEEQGIGRVVESLRNITVSSNKINTSTAEQSNGSRQIMAAIENINEMVNFFSRGIQEQRRGIEQILQSMMNIREISGSNERNSNSLNDIVEELNNNIEELNNVVRYFKLEEKN